MDNQKFTPLSEMEWGIDRVRLMTNETRSQWIVEEVYEYGRIKHYYSKEEDARAKFKGYIIPNGEAQRESL